eukprot:TRINITY_DN3353_c0_g1_i1.p2 TRINITY_DN3353_c0_g1~~TRINITY_DN3353_c0_g1_i1.p2  ORF type:complete len:486 (-),score=114.03 TRINITY_DN3353_c0_g1_i1:71-1528(-)
MDEVKELNTTEELRRSSIYLKFRLDGADDRSCPRCKLYIGASSTSIYKGVKYHTECITCSVCSRILSSVNFSEYESKFYCLKHFSHLDIEEDKTKTDADTTPTSQNTEVPVVIMFGDGASSQLNISPHNWESFINKHTLSWCGFCGDYLGSGNQSFLCSDCKYICHRECKHGVPGNCSHDPKNQLLHSRAPTETIVKKVGKSLLSGVESASNSPRSKKPGKSSSQKTIKRGSTVHASSSTSSNINSSSSTSSSISSSSTNTIPRRNNDLSPSKRRNVDSSKRHTSYNLNFSFPSLDQIPSRESTMSSPVTIPKYESEDKGDNSSRGRSATTTTITTTSSDFKVKVVESKTPVKPIHSKSDKSLSSKRNRIRTTSNMWDSEPSTPSLSTTKKMPSSPSLDNAPVLKTTSRASSTKKSTVKKKKKTSSDEQIPKSPSQPIGEMSTFNNNNSNLQKDSSEDLISTPTKLKKKSKSSSTSDSESQQKKV